MIDLFLLPIVIGLVRGKDRTIPEITDDTTDDNSGIRCPSCKWRPAKGHMWACHPGCGHVWNTFATRGECPSCEKRWSETQCVRCGRWSPHDEWYEREARS